MHVTITERGFELIDFRDANGIPCSIQQSSAIGDSPEPGSSFLWIGPGASRIHADREQVTEVVKHLQAWLATGSLQLADDNIPTGSAGGGSAGDGSRGFDGSQEY